MLDLIPVFTNRHDPQSGVKPTVSNAFNITTLNRRIEAAEEGIKKVSSMVDDLAKSSKGIKGKHPLHVKPASTSKLSTIPGSHKASQSHIDGQDTFTGPETGFKGPGEAGHDELPPGTAGVGPDGIPFDKDGNPIAVPLDANGHPIVDYGKLFQQPKRPSYESHVSLE